MYDVNIVVETYKEKEIKWDTNTKRWVLQKSSKVRWLSVAFDIIPY